MNEMIKHLTDQSSLLSKSAAAVVILTSLVSLAAATGCGAGSSDAELDRIPNVPPSTRGAEGAAVADPTAR